MKIIVIGCNHAGTWAAKTLKATDPKCQVVAYDRNDNISFLACGIALWVGGGRQKNPGKNPCDGRRIRRQL